MVNKVTSNDKILEEANYYLNNDVTIKQASSDLGISKRTLQLHFQKLESIDLEKARLVKDKKIANEKQGKIKGGSLGKRGPNWTREQAQQLADAMINNQMTNREAATTFERPKSTIYEMTHKGIEDELIESLLYSLAEANRKGLSMAEVLEKYYPEQFEKKEETKK